MEGGGGGLKRCVRFCQLLFNCLFLFLLIIPPSNPLPSSLFPVLCLSLLPHSLSLSLSLCLCLSLSVSLSVCLFVCVSSLPPFFPSLFPRSSSFPVPLSLPLPLPPFLLPSPPPYSSPPPSHIPSLLPTSKRWTRPFSTITDLTVCLLICIRVVAGLSRCELTHPLYSECSVCDCVIVCDLLCVIVFDCV